MAENTSAPPFCLPGQMYVGDSSCHRSSSEQLTCGLSVSVEKEEKKKRGCRSIWMFICVCVGLVVFLKSISSLALLLSLLLLSCVAQAVCSCPFPYGMEEPNSLTFIVTKDPLHHLQIWTNFSHCFSLENNPNSLYNALTREFPLLYTI